MVCPVKLEIYKSCINHQQVFLEPEWALLYLKTLESLFELMVLNVNAGFYFELSWYWCFQLCWNSTSLVTQQKKLLKQTLQFKPIKGIKKFFFQWFWRPNGNLIATRLKLTVFVFIFLHFIFSYVTCVVLYMTSITKHSLTEVRQTCKNPAKPTYLVLEMYSQGFQVFSSWYWCFQLC